MKKGGEILERYRRDERGVLLVEITAEEVKEIYSDFDKLAPFQKKELDEEFVDYLIHSVEEIGPVPFRISLSFRRPFGEEVPERIHQSLIGYFGYLDRLEREKRAGVLKRSLGLFGFGAGLLAAMVLLSEAPEEGRGLMGKILIEGLTVAAWVSLWESATRFVTGWFSSRRKSRLYRRIAAAELEVVLG